MAGYFVNGVEYLTHSMAVKAAKPIGANVVDGISGRIVWRPMPPVSKARMARYEQRKAAYEAQCRAAAR